LYWACKNGHEDIIQILGQKSDWNIQTFKLGQTPFYMACQYCSLEIATFGLECGANPTILDNVCVTSCFWASFNGNKVDIRNEKMDCVVYDSNAKPIDFWMPNKHIFTATMSEKHLLFGFDLKRIDSR